MSEVERIATRQNTRIDIIMTQRLKRFHVVAALAATAGVLALAGCGGGGGSDDSSWNGAGNGGGTSGSSIPASALQSSDGFIAYVKQVVANKLDTSEPIDLGDVVAPRNDTAEAVGI